MNLPNWLTEKLSNPPTAGAGVHAWLYSCARQLHAHMAPDQVAATLAAMTTNVGRRVTPREIRDAVNNSLAVAWSRDKSSQRTGGGVSVVGAPSPGASSSGWDKRHSQHKRNARVADVDCGKVGCVADLWEASPEHWPTRTPDDWLEILFPGAEWLCLATDHPATARSRPLERWTFGAADECGLIVPSPMTGPSGKGLDGRTSHRCLGNTGPRRWLVIEFDKLEDGITPMPLDQQAALHWHFRAEAERNGWPALKLVLHSGGKSLHGWYGPVSSEEQALALMLYAVGHGADPATWVRCQLVRLPAGVRSVKPAPPEFTNLPEWAEPAAGKVRQEVLFFDPTNHTPTTWPSSTSCTAHGAAQDSQATHLRTVAG